MPEGEYVLGYWPVRGIASPIRVAFALAGTPLTNKTYTGEEIDGKRVTDWDPEYKQLQDSNEHPFPNLPYLKMPDGTMIVQSLAILRGVGRQFKLYGDDTKTMNRVDELIDQFKDMMTDAFKNIMEKKMEVNVTEVIPFYLSTLEAYRKKYPTTFLCSDKPLIVDCYIHECLRALMPLVPNYATKYPKVIEMLKSFEALPQLQEYLKSDLNKAPLTPMLPEGPPLVLS